MGRTLYSHKTHCDRVGDSASFLQPVRLLENAWVPSSLYLAQVVLGSLDRQGQLPAWLTLYMVPLQMSYIRDGKAPRSTLSVVLRKPVTHS